MVKNKSLEQQMEKVEDIRIGETKEVRPMEKAEDSSKGQVTKRIIKGQIDKGHIPWSDFMVRSLNRPSKLSSA